MKLLVVDDEDGIREGLASYLRHHGHVVFTAASCAEAKAVLDGHARAAESLDAMVSDWRLTDGNAEPLLAQAARQSLPVVVVTGCPEEIAAGTATVLRKPVLPDALLAQLRGLVRPMRAITPTDPLLSLPADVQDRIALLLHGTTAVDVKIDDDGTLVTVSVDFGNAALPEAALPEAALPEAALLARLGGDWSVRSTGGGTRGQWRCYRDGRPASVNTVIGPREPWPARSAPLAIDLHGHAIDKCALLVLLDGVGHARAEGREVHLLNVPGHLRLWLELLGRAHELPMRTCSGPRLSAAPRQLWS